MIRLALLIALVAQLAPAQYLTRVIIAEKNGKKNEADVYLPDGTPPFAAIVLFPGGDGSQRKRLADKAELLRSAGYVVVLSDYALFPEQAPFPGYIHNAKAAVRFTRANAKRFRINRIFASGTSMGGVASSMVGTTGDVPTLEGDVGTTGVSSRVAGVIDFFGSVYFADLGGGAPDTEKVRRAYKVVFGCGDRLDCKAAEQLKPPNYVSAGDPPFLIIHGTDDKTSDPRQSKMFAEKLKAAGVPVTLKIMPGFGHNPELIKECIEDIKAFTSR